MLRVLSPPFEPVNNLICCKTGLKWVVKRATSLLNSFEAILNVFCCPFFYTFRTGGIKAMSRSFSGANKWQNVPTQEIAVEFVYSKQQNMKDLLSQRQ